MPEPTGISVRGLARAYEIKLQERLSAASSGGAAAAVRWPWPKWSPATLAIWLGMPKTAGTTLADIMIRKFPADRGFNAMRGNPTDSALGIQRLAGIGELWNELAPEARQAVRFTGGHLPFGLHRIFEVPSLYLTFVRDPVEHAISFYYFLAEVGTIQHSETMEPGRVSLERALDEGVFLGMHNYQTRILSGLAELDPPFRRFPSKAELRVPAAALDRAKRHLDELFFFVGVTERFDESIIILKEIFGWTLGDIVYTRKKVNANKPPQAAIPPGLRRKIAAVNGIDRELYDYCLDRFLDQAQAHRAAINAYLPILRLLNEAAEQAGSVDAELARPEVLIGRLDDTLANAPGNAPLNGPREIPAGEDQRDFRKKRKAAAAAAPSTEIGGSAAEPALLDLAPGAIAAFGLRSLCREAGGPIIHLRRESDGHLEHFGTGSDGRLNLTAIDHLLEGAAGSVVAWYDQSAAGCDAYPRVQRPLFVRSADGRPALEFSSPRQLRAPVTIEALEALSIFAVFRVVAIEDARSVARWQQEGHFVVFPYHTGDVLFGVHNRSFEAASLGVAAGEFAVYGVVWRQGAPDGFATYRNGALISRQAARDIPIIVGDQPLFIGSYGGAHEHFRGELTELVIWPRALSEDEIQAVSGNMNAAHADAGPGPNLPVQAASRVPLAARLQHALELDEAGLARIGRDRFAADLRLILSDPEFRDGPLDRQLPIAERIGEIYAANEHRSGRLLIAPVERVLDRVLSTGPDLDAICMLYDLLYGLYRSTVTDVKSMRAIADGVMRPVSAAIRQGLGCGGLPPVVRRPIGTGPLRIGYLSQYANSGRENALGPFSHYILGGLARHFPGCYRMVLYAWMHHAEETLAPLEYIGVRVRRFAAKSMAERIAAVSRALLYDQIDILITDMNSALPTVLFERRVAPVQIFCPFGVPFWPLANIDAVLSADPCDYLAHVGACEPARCTTMGWGPWDLAALAPEVDFARVAALRAQFPRQAQLIGSYGRLARVTPEYLETVVELLRRHPRLFVLLGGTGDATAIRKFIDARGLGERVKLFDQDVDAHLLGHLLEVFLDTYPEGSGVAGREMIAKGRPVVTLRAQLWRDDDPRVSTLVARDRADYAATVSRLLDDRSFYDEAVAATRALVASQSDDAAFAARLHGALTEAVERVRREQQSAA